METSETDWVRAEQEERRRPWWLLPAVAVWFGGFLLTQGGSPFGMGGLGWLSVLVLVLLIAGLVAVAIRRSPGLATSLRAQAALRLHADPGPGDREIADRLARGYEVRWWYALMFLYPPVTLTVGGRWDPPLATVTGGLLMLAALAPAVPWWRAHARAARRWREDPPGPPRELPPPTRAERWVPRLLGVGLGLVAIGWLLEAVGAFLD